MDTSLLKQLIGGERLPVIRQSEAAECALACVAMVAGFHGLKTDLISLRRHYGFSLKGANLKMLMQAADRMGLACRPVKAPLQALGSLKTPAILHWDLNHFVVLKQVKGDKAVIHDPARGALTLTAEEVSAHYTGVAVELTPTEAFQPRREKARLHLAQLWSRISGLKRTLGHLLILSAILQLFVIVSPFYMQIVIDDVLTKFDDQLLVVLAVGFGLFALINAAAQALRGYVLLQGGAMMSFQMATNLFAHLTRLPQDYFDKRHLGDILSRFGSLDPIKRMLTEGLVGGLIDGVMALTTLILMLIYAPVLALVVLGAFVGYAALRLGLYRRLRQQSEDAIIAKAHEDSNFMETVRGMLPIKLFGRQAERRQLWQNRFADSINADVKVGRTRLWFDLGNSLLFGIENVLVVYLAAKMVLAGGFSVGMVFAFMTYKRQFIDKAVALVERGIEFKMLDLHLERLADIALSEVEPDDSTLNAPAPLVGHIALKDVHFAYAEGEPAVIDGLSLDIPAGQSLAITGPSGSGKTTLLKILLGLARPQGGTIFIDDTPMEQYGVHAFRAQIGAVMQDDQLFAGSLADNIAFFDPEPDSERIAECAHAAAILPDIMAMPMRFETLVGDMGTTLSGGQKQRVLLARALYRRPKLLVLDEGTSHLDPATEAAVNQAIAELGITRILIAHRPETILSADRVVILAGGKIIADHSAASYRSACTPPATATSASAAAGLVTAAR